MKTTSRLVLALTGALALAAPGRAQLPGLPGSEPRRYVEFEIKGSAKQILEDRQELDKLKELVKQIAADPSKLPINLDKWKDQKLDDPKKKKALEDWLANDRELQDALRKLSKQKLPEKEPEKAKEFQDQLEKILDKAEDKGRDAHQAPDGPSGSEPEKGEDESLGTFAERTMKRAEGTKLGDWLRESPAWNRAFDDLRGSMNDPGSRRLRGNVLKEKLGGFDGDAWKLGAGALDRLKELPRPKMDKVNVAFPGMKNVPSPNLSVPGLPDFSGPSLPTFSTGLTWLLLVLFFLLSGWWALRWNRRAARTAAERASLGPWPVRPETVSTRTELIRAFDYLALWSLGLTVQSWNHQAVARRWGGRAELLQSAQALAHLYEQARYTDGAEPLADAERDLARRSLLQIKEALT